MKILTLLILLFTLTCCNNSKNEIKIEQREAVLEGRDTAQTKPIPIQKSLKSNTIKDTLKLVQKQTYSIPKAIDFNSYLVKKCKGTFDCRTEPFLPIGWSDNGHFAYCIEPDTEAAGAYVFQIFIQNIDNTIAWQWEFNQLEQEEWGDETIETIWKQNSKLFSQKLNQYGIQQIKDLKLQKFPFSIGDKTYISKQKTTKQLSEFFGTDELDQLSITFNEQAQEEKIIFSHDFKKNEMILHAETLGAMISPNSKNIMLLNTIVSRGWEGPPHIISVQVIMSAIE